MRLRELYTEMPYAAALKEDLLSSRCSMCFVKSASIRCDGGCQVVVYCSDECRDADQVSHKFECGAFKSFGSYQVDKFVRMLGRMLTRMMADDGAVNLCQNFPENVPDRRVSDLLSHQADIEGSKRRLAEMNEALDEFCRFYKDSSLVKDRDLLRRMYCVMWINCFSVSGHASLEKGFESSLGVGFYLNTSRFNHSCDPELHVDLDGSRLLMFYPSFTHDHMAVAQERSELTEDAEKFNQLTISYGYSQSFSNDGFFPLRYQRRASLKFIYYFQCQCDLCNNEVEAAMEQHAANVECAQCGKPYVWQKVQTTVKMCWSSQGRMKYNCVKTCQCSTSPKEAAAIKQFVKNVRAEQTLSELEGEWLKATSFRLKELYANQIVDRCESVLMKASKVWHPAANLRFAHLSERVFISYNVIVKTALKRKQRVKDHEIEMALLSGEWLLSWQQNRRYNMFSTAIAAYSNDLGQLYEIGASMSNTDDAATMLSRAGHWYRHAASIWAVVNGEHPSTFVTALESKAEQVEKLAIAANAGNGDEVCL